MRNFEDLEKFIRDNGDWMDMLTKPPYSMKSVHMVYDNQPLVAVMYNLFESDLSNPIVRQCRGTVIDKTTGKVVCAPYVKFFNLGEQYADNIDWTGKLSVTEKMDGWMIKMFTWRGGQHWVSNGGYDISKTPLPTNKTVIELCSKYFPKFGVEIPDGWTFMMEFIHPEMKIVCDYPEDKWGFWLHGARDPKGEEWEVMDVIKKFQIEGIKVPDVIQFKGIDHLVDYVNQRSGKDFEGCVVRDGHWRRVKMKGVGYLELKAISDNLPVTPKRIWETWASGEWDDMRDGKLKTEVLILNDKVRECAQKINIWEGLGKYLSYTDRKALALTIQNDFPKELHGLLYHLTKHVSEGVENAVRDFALCKQQNVQKLFAFIENLKK